MLPGFLQRREHTVAHLCRSRAGKGDRENLFGLLDGGKQGQEAQGEQLGFAGASRRLHQKGLSGVDGIPACGLIVGEQGRRVLRWGERRVGIAGQEKKLLLRHQGRPPFGQSCSSTASSPASSCDEPGSERIRHTP